MQICEKIGASSLQEEADHSWIQSSSESKIPAFQGPESLIFTVNSPFLRALSNIGKGIC